MNHFARAFGASLLTMAVSTSAAFAQGVAITGFHPYFCEASGENPMTTSFVNFHNHRFVLQVTVPQQNIDFNCENAGGLVRLSNSVSFQSISVLVKTMGDVDLCNDIDFAFFIQGNSNPQFVCLTGATQGRTTPDGFTLYTLNASNIGYQGTRLTLAGMEVARDPARPNEGRREGFIFFDKFSINGVVQNDNTQLETACPFSFCK